MIRKRELHVSSNKLRPLLKLQFLEALYHDMIFCFTFYNNFTLEVFFLY